MSRPGDVWPEIWQLMSQTQDKKAIVDWRVKSAKANDARGKRGISAENNERSMLGILIQPKATDKSDPGKGAAPSRVDGVWGGGFPRQHTRNDALENGERCLRSGGRLSCGRRRRADHSRRSSEKASVS